MEKCVKQYYLGSMSQGGFKSDFYSEIAKDGVFTYILKGGAGTGKSSLMKKVAKEFEKTCDVTKYFCSSDPNSLDAVFVREAGVMVVDGTSPHTFDPDFPAVKQVIVNLGDHWDDEKLKENTDKIISVTKSHKKLMSRAKSYVSAMTKLFDDTYYSVSDDVLTEKLALAVQRLSQKIMPKKQLNQGSVSLSLVGAVTPMGYKLRSETLDSFDNIYSLDDDCFGASDAFLKSVAEQATKKGFDVVVSRCNLFSESVYEAVMIPKLKTAFVASTPLNLYYSEKAVKVNMQRFYDKDSLGLKKKRLKMNKSACAKLLEEATQTLASAKSVHDEIEKYYISAMDFSGVDSYSEKIISDIGKKLSVKNPD